MKTPDTYIIRGGVEGKRRLEVLSRVMWPTSLRLLLDAGLTTGMSCLDVGCGGGDVTLELARLVGPAGHVTGMDMDATKLQMATEEATRRGLKNVQFHRLNIEEWVPYSVVDSIYSRFLLTHLTNPQRLVEKMREAVRPGGLLVIEDIDFAGYFCHPECAAFESYVRLYRETAAKRGADSEIGPKLYEMLLDAGWQDVQVNVVQPTFASGEGKQISLLTLINIADSIVAAALASESELQTAIDELTQFTENPRTIISMPRVFQVWGRKG